MVTRILVTVAGSGGSNNLIHSLRMGDPTLSIIGCHEDRFVLKKSLAARNYLVPLPDLPSFPRALRRVVETEKIDLIIPTSDPDVSLMSELRHQIPCRLFLPPKSVITLCQDKYELARFLQSRGVPVPVTHPVTDLGGISELFGCFPSTSRLWCRRRSGSGSMAAIPVTTAHQARAWITFWEETWGTSPSSFTLSEYLPGRDFACQSLWKGGRLVLLKTFERLTYFGGDGRPSGVSSIAGLAKTVREPRVAEVSEAAIRALGDNISGAFEVDLKEDAAGVPRVTEINAGRFISGTCLFDLTGKHNMAVTYVRLALDQPVSIEDEYDTAEDYYMVRDLDTLPGIFHAEELFQGFEDART